MNKKSIIIRSRVVLVIAIIATSIVLAVLLSKDDPSGEPPKGGGIVYDPNQGEYDPNKNPGANAVEGVAVPGFGTWTIPPNVTKVVTDFYNPEKNAGKFDMTFEVRIPDNSEQGYEVIYKSGLVKAGNHIQNVTLSRSFEKGEYEAYLFVQPYTADEDQIPTNNVNIKFKLIVK